MKIGHGLARYATTSLAIVLFAAAIATEAAAQSPTGARSIPSGAATAVDVGPTIDGSLDDPMWALAEPLTNFVQYEPVEGASPSERTEVRFLYTSDALYVGAWLYDQEPGRIITGERRRDASLTDSDAVLLVFDTFRDGQSGFFFGTNPGGIEHDGQVRGASGANTSWDGSWTVATSRDGEGWYAEMRIPFSTLRYGPAEAQTWGLNIIRYIGRKNEQVVWSPIARHFGFWRLTEAGLLHNLRPPPRRIATVTPYVLGAARRVPPADVDVAYPFEWGVDAKFGITRSLALDLTLNTDFAQVEADDQQVDLTRFNLFFPEKRPFFLENSGLFSVGQSFLPGRTSGRALMFHSRRIGVDAGRQVPIEWGTRMSGRVTGTDIGLLHMRTEALAGQSAADWSVARLARELPSRSQIGVIVTSRAASDRPGADYNRTFAVDGRLGIGDIWTFTGLAGFTDSPQEDESTELIGVVGEYLTRNWYVRGYYDQIGRNFNPAAGYTPYTGFRENSIRVERIIRPEVEWLREVRTHVRRTLTHDLSGFTELDFRHWHSNFNFEGGAIFSPALNWQMEGLDRPFAIRGTDIVVPEGTYSGWTSYATFRTNPSAALSLNGRYDVGSFLSGDRIGGTAGVSFRRGATVTGGVSITHNRLSFPQADYNTTLSRLDLQYAFSPGVFLQSLLQYSDQTGLWSSNVRFGWLDTAGTGLFLVYNEQQTMDVNGISGLWPRDSLQLPARTLALKFTRQFDVSGIHGMFDDD